MLAPASDPPGLVLLLAPLVPLVPAPDFALPFALDEEPDDFSFLDFIDFFLAFGLVSVVASELSVDAPEVAPAEPLSEEELPLAPGNVDEPEVVLPPVPDPPDEVSLLPEALDPEVPLAPDVPDVEDSGCDVFAGTLVEAPVPPAMPASLPVPAPVAPVAFCDWMVDDGSVALLLPDCAKAMDDTDATTTSESVRRVVFNVMSNSFELKKSITDAATWMQAPPACSRSASAKPVGVCQLIEFKDFLSM